MILSSVGRESRNRTVVPPFFRPGRTTVFVTRTGLWLRLAGPLQGGAWGPQALNTKGPAPAVTLVPPAAACPGAAVDAAPPADPVPPVDRVPESVQPALVVPDDGEVLPRDELEVDPLGLLDDDDVVVVVDPGGGGAAGSEGGGGG